MASDTTPLGASTQVQIAYRAYIPGLNPDETVELAHQCNGNEGPVSLMKDGKSLLVELASVTCDAGTSYKNVGSQPFKPNNFLIHLDSNKQAVLLKNELTSDSSARLHITDQECDRSKTGASSSCSTDSRIVQITGSNGTQLNVPAYTESNIAIALPHSSAYEMNLEDYFTGEGLESSGTQRALVESLQKVVDFSSTKVPRGESHTSQVYKGNFNSSNDEAGSPTVIFNDSGIPQ
jgi:hypothetical protein